ncbi:MAG: DEAD/DEAH box helicase [Methanomicrobiales archaeon]|nr:DEAD/DEAH box helicase [Methanomicrobiales archaeon]
METFSRLHEGVKDVISHRLGWSELRPVQEETCRAVSDDRDVLVIAPTAGGKTEAALIPVIDGIMKDAIPGVAALYLAPLKALINDQEERFSAFCLPNGLELGKWHGDVPRGDRAWKDEEAPHILMITPESLEVLLMERHLSSDLRNLRYIIIDELHAFVESDRGVHMRVLLDRLDRIAGRNIQRIGLSATVGNPGEILSWLSGGRHGEALVQIPAPAREKHFTFVVEEREKRRMQALARIIAGKKALVFVNSRSDAESVTRALSGKVEQLLVHHSSLSSALRKEAEEAFSGEGSACIICTSTLELGIDIGDLDVVVQVGTPGSVSSFLQRMGRSGRRGKPPFVSCVLKNADELLCMVAVIESASRNEVEPLRPPEKPFSVLVQQILLELLRTRRSSRTRIRRFVRGLAPFRALRGREIDAVLAHMMETGMLENDGDMLMAGQGAEQAFGRSNWKDLYSVISGGGEFRAVTPDGEVVGKLDARFVAGKSGKSFSLGGKSWKFVKSDESHELVVVVPGEGERSEVFWTGSQAGFSPVVCHAVEEILVRGASILPLPGKEQEILAAIIGEYPPLRSGALHVLEKQGEKGPEVTILTFRGRRFNGILSALLRAEAARKVTISYNDFSVTLKNVAKEEPAGVVFRMLEDIRKKTPRLAATILKIPGQEVWKFSLALPGNLLREMALLDYYRFPEFHRDLAAAELVVVPPGEP